MMLSPILSVFVLITFLPILFSTAADATTSKRTLNCYKYEAKFAGVNIIDSPIEEKNVTQCDQCFGYLCYKNDKYILGYGCREDFFKSCNFTSEIKAVITGEKNEEMCGDVDFSDALLNACLKDYCNSKSFTSCIVAYSEAHKTQKHGPGYFLGNFTFTQLTTPAPTTTTPTTTESAFNPDNGNGGKSQNGSDDSGNKNDPSSANSKMIPFIFFCGIFIFAYLM